MERLLDAGPFTVRCLDGELRSLALGEEILMQRLAFAFRDSYWGTPALTAREVRCEASCGSFHVELEASVAGVSLDLRLRLAADADGTITASFEAIAGADFWKNRLGWCLLYPASCAGLPCRWRTASCEVDRVGTFPLLIAPHQPLRGLVSFAHCGRRGDWLEAEFEGDLFELEDQRNWSDGSFKVYSTPLDRPHPVLVRAGQRISQRITLRPAESVRRPQRARPVQPIRLALGPGGRMPELGVDITYLDPDTAPQWAHATAALGLAFLWQEVQPAASGWQKRLDAGLALAASAGTRLLPVLLVEDAPPPEALWLRLAQARPLIEAVAITRCGPPWETTPAMVEAALFALGHAGAAGLAVGAGTAANFAELNRLRPVDARADFFFYSLNPQVHLSDDESLLDNLEGQAPTVHSTAAFAAARPITVGPVTLAPRFYAASARRAPVGAPQFPQDRRLHTPVGLAWTAASLCCLAVGADRICCHALAGPGGLLGEAPGQRLPAVAELVAEMAALRGERLHALAAPPPIHAVAVAHGGRLRCCVVNAGRDSAAVELAGRVRRLAPLEVLRCEVAQ